MPGLRSYLGQTDPGTADQHILEGALGNLVLRPWFDWIAVRSIAHGYFPLSRAWAAAQEAQGSVDRFVELAATREISTVGIRWMLDLVERRRQRYEEANAKWLSAFFETSETRTDDLIASEANRRAAAHEHMSTRAAFVPLLGRVSSVRWEVATPDQVALRHEARLLDTASAFAAPEPQEITTSNEIPSATGRDYWLRFNSPHLGDQAWARVSAPAKDANAPTLIFLHGICVESDMWTDATDPLNGGALEGFRVVRPEAPWHSRRVKPGWYGGEPAIGQGPLGFLDLFEAWVAETSVLIDWARRTSRGPVAIGGVSLGALTSQLAAVAARSWYSDLQPDALFLVATSGAILDVVQSGSLATAVKLQSQLDRAGWSGTELARWVPLLEPQGHPAISRENIVVVLGESDDLTPHAGGAALARAWSVPAENVFQRPQGHFSVSLGLLRDPSPIRRLAQILDRQRK